MRFSLRWLLALIVVICLVLGAREARRSYLWHRTLPVNYFMGQSRDSSSDTPISLAEWPSEIPVQFEKSLVQEVRLLAEQRRKNKADEVFQAMLNFTANTELNHSFKFPDFAARRSARMSSAAKQRIRKRFQELFLGEHGLSEASQTHLVQHWLVFRDDAAIAYAIQILKSANTAQRLSMLKAVQALNRHDCFEWLSASSELEEAIVSCFPLAQLQVSQLAQELRLKSAIPRLKEAVANLEIKNHIADSSSEEAAKFKLKLGLLQQLCILSPDQDVLSMLEELKEHLVRRTPAVPSDAETQEELLQEGVKVVVARQKYHKALLSLGERAQGKVRTQAASLAYQLNDFQAFAKAATAGNQIEFAKLFRLRDSLASKGRYATRYDDGVGFLRTDTKTANSIEFEFHQALFNPVTGFESPFLINDLINRLYVMEESFAHSCMLELVGENVPMAILNCGDFLKETDVNTIWALKQQMFDARKLEGNSVFMRPPTLRPLSTRFIGSNRLFDSLYRITPESMRVPPFEDRFDLLKRMDELPSLEALKSLLSKHGLTFEFEKAVETSATEGWRDGLSETELHKEFLLRSFQESGRYSQHVRVGPDSVPEVVDYLMSSSEGGFQLDGVEDSVETLGEETKLRFASGDRVYSIRLADKHVDPSSLSICDLLNHILEREHVAERFVVLPVWPRKFNVLSSAVYKPDLHILFGRPELFRELQDQFLFEFAAGSENYFEMK